MNTSKVFTHRASLKVRMLAWTIVYIRLLLFQSDMWLHDCVLNVKITSEAKSNQTKFTRHLQIFTHHNYQTRSSNVKRKYMYSETSVINWDPLYWNPLYTEQGLPLHAEHALPLSIQITLQIGNFSKLSILSGPEVVQRAFTVYWNTVKHVLFNIAIYNTTFAQLNITTVYNKYTFKHCKLT